MHRKKYNFPDTMMDERLIGQYKDEVNHEIADSLGIDFADSAIREIDKDPDMLSPTNNKFNDIRTQNDDLSDK